MNEEQKQKPVLLVKFGDRERGWLPSTESIDDFLRQAKATGLTEKYNIITTNYAVDMSVVGTREELRNCGIKLASLDLINQLFKEEGDKISFSDLPIGIMPKGTGDQLVLDTLEYKSMGSQVFSLKTAEPGEVISFKKDSDMTAFAINEDGAIGIIEQGTVVFPVAYTLTAEGKDHDAAIEELIRQKDDLTMKLLLTCVTSKDAGNKIVVIDNRNTNIKDNLENVQFQIERHRLITDKFIIPRNSLGKLKRDINALDYDPIYSKDLLLKGISGSIWGINIFLTTSTKLFEDSILAVAEGRYLGRDVVYDCIVEKTEQGTCKITYKGSQCILNSNAIAISMDRSLCNVIVTPTQEALDVINK